MTGDSTWRDKELNKWTVSLKLMSRDKMLKVLVIASPILLRDHKFITERQMSLVREIKLRFLSTKKEEMTSIGQLELDILLMAASLQVFRYKKDHPKKVHLLMKVDTIKWLGKQGTHQLLSLGLLISNSNLKLIKPKCKLWSSSKFNSKWQLITRKWEVNNNTLQKFIMNKKWLLKNKYTSHRSLNKMSLSITTKPLLRNNNLLES